MKLKDKVAILTGGARGIGKACALALAKEGAHVCVTDIIPMEETLNEIKSLGREALGITTDVSKKGDVLAMVAQVIEKFGKIDILVNNAGTCQRVPLEELTEEQWDRDVNTIMKGTFLCTQAVYPHMKKSGSGKIVNIASISGKIGGAVSKKGAGVEGKRGRSGPAYAAAKGGVIAFTKWVAKDAGCYGIYVNAIAPGGIETDMSKGFVYPIEDLPISRMGKPEDVAQMVVFLASDASNYTTGQTINVDGGWVMD
ncbi:MAG: 3-oxoacyl-ACP reductase FabG [Deltaproteobacteria bacterium]|nr:3-oxoacyl-ACP reductase FabG [Deltaproteobacteria bacterium]